uniref:Uncharacterized protein n=1 Tax=Myotis myotis TaxID=51298 RepID=A0A7J7TTN8_MYOMY|nr:hypothetical protein mMyoMyo1_008964 [Myotis myotis]
MSGQQDSCPQPSPWCGNESNSAKPGAQRAPRPPAVAAVASVWERQAESGGSDHQCEHQKWMFRLRRFHLSIRVGPIPDSLGGMETLSHFQEASSMLPSCHAPGPPREWLVLPGTLLSHSLPTPD